MRNADTILGLIRERGSKGLPLERVYKLLYEKDLYLKAYGKIYGNKGAMTHGVTDETPDGMSLDKIDAVIKALRYERYQWLPARRVHIPKKNGKKRPLGMPVWSDKLLQEVLRLILEAYFEPQFSDHSHGFRPKRGCHTALREVYHKWKGTVWFIEGDISQCFDRLDHELLINALEKHIHDGRFIALMRGLLDAGYMEDWTFNQTLSGVPQGGVVSPILSNILLDTLDKFVETVLIPKYTKGAKKSKRLNLEYQRLANRAFRERQKGNVEEAGRLKKQYQRLPSLAIGPHYRRLHYVRYADDFLLGFVGTKAEAEEIKQQLGEFLRDELKLELSQAKTLITHARSEAAKFLGYEVTVLHEDGKQTPSSNTGVSRRSINGVIGLRVPYDVIEEKRKRYMRGKKAIQRAELLGYSDYAIISTYQLEFRGIANYYRLAHNLTKLGKLKWVMDISLMKTLAAKHKTTTQNIRKKHRKTIVRENKEYQVLQASIPRKDKEPLVATWGGVPLVWDIKATIKEQPPKLYGGRTELERRLLAETCEYCGSQEDVEVHHVRAMKNLHAYPGRPKPEWVKRMIALKRKTMPLCRTCHEDVHAGRPMRRHMIKIEEVNAIRKEAMTAVLESRVL
jgi:group II intron reverse transcriptase/maturase